MGIWGHPASWRTRGHPASRRIDDRAGFVTDFSRRLVTGLGQRPDSCQTAAKEPPEVRERAQRENRRRMRRKPWQRRKQPVEKGGQAPSLVAGSRRFLAGPGASPRLSTAAVRTFVIVDQRRTGPGRLAGTDGSSPAGHSRHVATLASAWEIRPRRSVPHGLATAASGEGSARFPVRGDRKLGRCFEQENTKATE
jgi:hypothetical protein